MCCVKSTVRYTIQWTEYSEEQRTVNRIQWTIYSELAETIAWTEYSDQQSIVSRIQWKDYNEQKTVSKLQWVSTVSEYSEVGNGNSEKGERNITVTNKQTATI